jgi:MerR family redox-sensitive transcriptional activator SoxR
MAELRIGEVAARSGIATSAIRYYESEGLIPRPARISGQRVYEESIVDRLGLIDLAKRAGFTVAEIKKLLAGFSRRTPPGERWRKMTRAKLDELDERIAEAERMKRVLRAVERCQCPTLSDCGRALKMRSPARASG